MAANANVALGHDGPIATVTLSRPEYRNSLSDAMLGELAETFAALRDTVPPARDGRRAGPLPHA